MGIEPTLVAWEATVLPLNYTRIVTTLRLRMIIKLAVTRQAPAEDGHACSMFVHIFNGLCETLHHQLAFGLERGREQAVFH
jgi:hypothetical protein